MNSNDDAHCTAKQKRSFYFVADFISVNTKTYKSQLQAVERVLHPYMYELYIQHCDAANWPQFYSGKLLLLCARHLNNLRTASFLRWC